MIRIERLYNLIEKPLITEKSVSAAGSQRRHSFRVAVDATKGEISAAVSKLFSVKVESVNVISVKGKKKNTRGIAGCRKDWKKAVVKLAPGNDIDFAGSS